ncbi:DUF4268 domain-containing protein [Halorubrum yunnanense]|uniref:DUF4268 domain-containing protein n=1 Tax=Halorubrum yunnanense TaxID=1526162 RepID=A0ABD5Y9A9_9EURY|nr:DUF4268 domain-containing protein [Halorubrum yunnanense]
MDWRSECRIHPAPLGAGILLALYKERNEEIFEALKRERTDIESNLGVELEWERLPEKQASRIKQPEDIDRTITDLTADQRNHLVEWGVDAMDEFQEEFEPRLSALGSS